MLCVFQLYALNAKRDTSRAAAVCVHSPSVTQPHSTPPLTMVLPATSLLVSSEVAEGELEEKGRKDKMSAQMRRQMSGHGVDACTNSPTRHYNCNRAVMNMLHSGTILNTMYSRECYSFRDVLLAAHSALHRNASGIVLMTSHSHHCLSPQHSLNSSLAGPYMPSTHKHRSHSPHGDGHLARAPVTLHAFHLHPIIKSEKRGGATSLEGREDGGLLVG